MLPTPWQSIVNKINNGEPVDETTINRPLSQLVKRDQHLKDLLDLLAFGETLFFRSVPVDASVAVGQPVYLNPDTQKFEAALATVDFDDSGVVGQAAESALTWGVVQVKHTATTADIITTGMARGVDMSAAIDNSTDEASTGAYYLSSSEPGKLTKQKPPVSVFVLQWWANEQVALVMPTPRDLVESHVHYRFELTAKPAGQHNDPIRSGDDAQVQDILTADTDAPGWLPAAEFPTAPAGAVFGYNLDQHPELASVFPPIPINSYYLEVNAGFRGTGRDDSDVILDNTGIWWMTQDYGFAPWSPMLPLGIQDPGLPNSVRPVPPELLEDGLNPWGSISSSSSGDPSDFGPYQMSIYLWFTKMVFKTDEAAVTSLQPGPDEPFEITSCTTGLPATRGDLKIALNLALGINEEDIRTDTVLATVSGTDFDPAKVVARIKTSTPDSIQIVGDEPDPVGFPGEYAGFPEINFVGDFGLRELGATIAALDNVREENYNGIYFLGFLSGRTSDVRFKYEMPTAFPGGTTEATATINLRVLGTVPGVMPELSASYRIIPATTSLASVPTTDSALQPLQLQTINGGTPISGFDYIDYTFALIDDGSSNPVSLEPGDTLFVEFERGAAVGAYAGTVGFMSYPLLLSFS